MDGLGGGETPSVSPSSLLRALNCLPPSPRGKDVLRKNAPTRSSACNAGVCVTNDALLALSVRASFPVELEKESPEAGTVPTSPPSVRQLSLLRALNRLPPSPERAGRRELRDKPVVDASHRAERWVPFSRLFQRKVAEGRMGGSSALHRFFGRFLLRLDWEGHAAFAPPERTWARNAEREHHCLPCASFPRGERGRRSTT